MAANERSARSRALLAGVIVHSGGRTLNCAVRNVSADGALVKLEAVAHPASPLILVIPKNDVVRYAALAWQKESEIGLQLGDPVDLQNPKGAQEIVARQMLVERRLR